MMEKQKLLEQEDKAFQKYRYFYARGRDFLATYWFRKYKKFSNMKKLAAAFTKRQIKANGVTKLNTTKI